MKNEMNFLLILILFLPSVFAASVTPATGGTNISSSTAGGNYTNLAGPVISEAGRADIGNGTIILVVPSGFEFDASASITVKITRTAGTGGNARNINNVANGTSAAVSSKNSTHIVFTIIDTTTNNVRNSLTWQNVKVRPTAALPLANGNITSSGNSSIVGVPSGTALGQLIETGVADSTPPVVSVPANIVSEATSSSGAVVNFTANATDNVDGSLVPTCIPSQGSTFPLGITTVTCSATDSSNNTGTNNFNITVQDTTSPIVNVPANIIAEATSSSGASVVYTATATDTVDGSLVPVCNPSSGSTFPFGTTTVSCNATDSSLNTGTNTFTITIQDTTPPVITVPANIIAEATSPSGVTVTYTATAADAVDGSLVPICTSSSGSVFPFGTTVVACNATDSSNNTATNSFNITVQDSTPPSITVPANIISEAANSSGALINYTVNVSDLVDASPSVVCVPASGSVFSLNVTIVNCSAIDFSGNVISASFNVTVVDTTSPVISAPANISIEATGNLTIVLLGSPVVSDAVDLSPVVVNDSPASFPVGVTFVNWTATDIYNNSANASQKVEIVDTTAPIISLLGSNPVQIALNSVYVDDGATAVDIVNGNLTGSILVSGTVNTNTAGTYLVTYNVNDTAGNSAVAVYRTVYVVPASGRGNGYQSFLSGFVSGGVIPSVSPFSDVSSPEPQQITPLVAEVVSQPVAGVNSVESAPAAPLSKSPVPKITGAFSLNDADLKGPVLWSSIAGAALLLGVLGYFAFRKFR